MVVIPLPLRERERERERESVCVCVCEECETSRSEAVRVGPAWLQRHGCGFVTGVRPEVNDGGHARAKRGKERSVFFD